MTAISTAAPAAAGPSNAALAAAGRFVEYTGEPAAQPASDPAPPLNAGTLQFSADRKRFAASLTKARKFTPSRSPKAILTGVRVAVTGGDVTLTATDLDASGMLTVPAAEGEANGVAIVCPKALGKWLRASKGNTIRVSADAKSVRFADDRTAIVLPAIDAADNWPDFADAAFDWLGCWSMQTADLAAVLRHTVPATDPESLRYALGGVALCPTIDGDHDLTAIATDGRRLHTRTAFVDSDIDAAAVAESLPILPVKACKALEAWGRRAIDDVTIGVGESLVRVSGRTWSVTMRRLDGRFPRWRDVVPSRSCEFAALHTVGPLRDALTSILSSTSDDARGVDLEWQPQPYGATLRLTAGPDDARGVATVPGDILDGLSGDAERERAEGDDSSHVTLDPSFLLDAIRDGADDDTVRIALNADTPADSPVVVTTFVDGYSQDCDHPLRAVLMPLARAR